MRTALGLVGDARIAGSASPAIHDAIFGPGTYTLIADVDAAAALDRAEATCRGINVTAPHKVAALERYGAVTDDAARRVGAVNTVVYDDAGRATMACNTDVEGLLVAWRRASVVVEGRRLAVIGAGGAARAVVVAAAAAGATAVIVHARRRAAAAGIVSLAAGMGLDAAVADGVDADRADIAVIAASDLDEPAAWLGRALRPAGVVHDLRYGARPFATRNAALRAGHFFLDGASMLLGQALAAAVLFKGGPLDEGARLRAASALAARLQAIRAR